MIILEEDPQGNTNSGSWHWHTWRSKLTKHLLKDDDGDDGDDGDDDDDDGGDG